MDAFDDAWSIFPRTGASSGHMYTKSTGATAAPSRSCAHRKTQ